MRLTKHEQDVVCRKFCCYCVKILRGAALNYLEELKVLWEKEISLSYLKTSDRKQPLVYDSFLDTEYFMILGIKIPIRDADISEALCCLPEEKRKIILMYFFLGMTEKEIGSHMNLVQSTVHYHKEKSLKLMKEILEER